MVKFFEGGSAISLGDRAQNGPAAPRFVCPCSMLLLSIRTSPLWSLVTKKIALPCCTTEFDSIRVSQRLRVIVLPSL